MAGQICPIFERENEEKITLIGAWLMHPINLKIVPNDVNFMEIGHIAPMLSAFVNNENFREISNSFTEVGNGCKFIDGAFIMGTSNPAPNEQGGLADKDFIYSMKSNQGVTILVREKITKQNNSNTKNKWWQF